jgi:7-keto-8-aminopelargonate synthetase-like enzyme
LGSLDDVLVIGSLSKAFSCLGAFVTCDLHLKLLLKVRANTFIFGGPVPPPYLAAIIAVCDLLESPEYNELITRLRNNVDRLTAGVENLNLPMTGGHGAVISVGVGDIEKTLKAGKWLFDRGFYVQSATYPAVPIMGGILRIQVNANHSVDSIDCLIEALADLKTEFNLGSAPS